MTKFETYTGKNNELYFRLVNEKGEMLLTSEGYRVKDNLINGIESVKKNITDGSKFELKMSANGKHFFNLKASNGQVIGSSAMWDSTELRDQWMRKMKHEVPQAEIIELKN